jgi:hypothetical protein
VADGQITAHSERTHLFYVGPVHNADFKNFELNEEVMTRQGANLGRLEYSIEMVKQCGLKWQDIFVPKPAGRKPIQVKK